MAAGEQGRRTGDRDRSVDGDGGEGPPGRHLGRASGHERLEPRNGRVGQYSLRPSASMSTNWVIRRARVSARLASPMRWRMA